MKIGIFSPVVVHHPASASAWEAEAGIAELADIAAEADDLGFHHITCSEHVAIPTDVAAERGGTYWDPLATFGYLAARTRRIKFATQVLVLGYHHPLDVAKRYGTLDAVSGGRLILGVGVGSLQEEFELIGAQFDGRGAVADDAMRALRASLGRTAPSYSGTHFTYDDWIVSPAAVQERVPMWVGGRTPRSLRRAVELGDGWVPFGLPHARLSEMLAGRDLPGGFEVVLSAESAVDPAGDPAGCRAALEATRDAGATIATITIAARSAAHYREQLAALAERAREAGAQLG
ncbi:LLM class F420-dependent oxidoreductase [Tomitella gaofuii]|uniref:LLM class F420-dependent oxidoreductase n=1 Tax=Tomitella gaofuii TaxID=2760083 RepID=UPI0015F7BA1A|nr:LLM class F420-dependent oxidoreductase [Tomitella gaofuii]